MILVGIGANLPSSHYGPPRATCGAALEIMSEAGMVIAARSRWYKSAPVPVSDQPWFVNAVIQIKTALDPLSLMGLLLQTEETMGRKRSQPNAPRTLDLDLLAYDEIVMAPEDTPNPSSLIIPHPRLQERAFVLLPLRDIAPNWRHPVLNISVREMIENLPKEQKTDPMHDAGGVFGTEWQDKAPPKQGPSVPPSQATGK